MKSAAPVSSRITPVRHQRDKLLILNQLLLPHQTEYVEVSDEKQTADSIRKMHIRGAPAIGIAAAFGYYLGAWKLVNDGKKITAERMEKIRLTLNASRPTAVNLFWATERMAKVTSGFLNDGVPMKDSAKVMKFLMALYEEAISIRKDDEKRCLLMSEKAADFLTEKLGKRKFRIHTHCNTGALATGGIGTALGVIRVLHARGQVEMVFADETRPYLQGSRLTAYELKKDRIPVTLIADSAAAFLMKKGMIDFSVVGADRITRRGDVANKIGTYGVSLACREHKLPFLVVAPLSTFDEKMISGEEIPVEERSPAEVLQVGEHLIGAKVPVVNPSFDVTPYENITAIFSEQGMFRPEQ